MKKTAYFTTENEKEKKEEWLAKLKIHEKHWKEWETSESALLVIDAQNYFLDSDSHAYLPVAPIIKRNIIEWIDLFEGKNRPIFFTTFAVEENETDPINEWWGHTVKEGSFEAKLHPEIDAKRQGNTVLRKRTYNAFLDTDLDKILKEKRIKNLVITGVVSNLCCDSTAREAFNHGYCIFFAIDATGAYDEDSHLSTLKNLAQGFATPITLPIDAL